MSRPRLLPYFSLVCLALTLPSGAKADKELKAKTKQVFKDTGEVFKHLYRKTKQKTAKAVHKVDQKLSGGDGAKETSSAPSGESK